MSLRLALVAAATAFLLLPAASACTVPPPPPPEDFMFANWPEQEKIVTNLADQRVELDLATGTWTVVEAYRPTNNYCTQNRVPPAIDAPGGNWSLRYREVGGYGSGPRIPQELDLYDGEVLIRTWPAETKRWVFDQGVAVADYETGTLAWIAWAAPPAPIDHELPLNASGPHFMRLPEGKMLVASSETSDVYLLDPATGNTLALPLPTGLGAFEGMQTDEERARVLFAFHGGLSLFDVQERAFGPAMNKTDLAWMVHGGVLVQGEGILHRYVGGAQPDNAIEIQGEHVARVLSDWNQTAVFLKQGPDAQRVLILDAWLGIEYDILAPATETTAAGSTGSTSSATSASASSGSSVSAPGEATRTDSTQATAFTGPMVALVLTGLAAWRSRR